MREQDLDPAPGRAPGVEACREDRGVVDDEEIARPEFPGQVLEARVPQRPRLAVDDQQPALLTPRQGTLRDPFGRQRVVEQVRQETVAAVDSPSASANASSRVMARPAAHWASKPGSPSVSRTAATARS